MNARQKIELYSTPDPNSGCWLWTGATNGQGYGSMRWNGKTASSYKVSYLAFVGPVAEGLELDHLCRTPSCVNPAHLEAVTRSVNQTRGLGPQRSRERQLEKTHCKRGHPLSGDNIRLLGPKKFRVCKECQKIRKPRYEPRKYPEMEPREATILGARLARLAKTHCKHGHEWTPENTGRQKNGRLCRTCHRIQEAQRRQQRKGA